MFKHILIFSYELHGVNYLTDNLCNLPGVCQLWCIIRSNVVALLKVEGFFVFQLHNNGTYI